MTVSEKCKIGPSVECSAKLIIDGLRKKRIESGIWYLVTTAPDQDETLYVMSKSELTNGLYDHMKLHVVALAGTQSEAFALITQMVQEACDQGRLYELKKFFMEY